MKSIYDKDKKAAIFETFLYFVLTLQAQKAMRRVAEFGNHHQV